MTTTLGTNMRRDLPVVALDIDGTLGEWHEHFRQFISNYTGKLCPHERPGYWTGEGPPPRYDGTAPFWKWLGVSKATYRAAKLAFRQGGYKRWMYCYDGVPEMVRSLRRKSQVWICTTRPYLRLDNIDPDTRHWLRRNGLAVDGVIFGEHKYRDLRNIVGADRVAGVLDDDPVMIMQANGVGLPAVLREQPWNTPSNWPLRAMGIPEASNILHMLVSEWKDKQ